MFEIPAVWTRCGLVLAHRQNGKGLDVIGDPCIVWDATISGWRMFLFADPPGHGQAICMSRSDVGPGNWQFLGPLPFTNAELLPGGHTHKPFVVMDPYHPNHAARIEGQYCLVTVNSFAGQKVVQQAWADQLTGPWTLTGNILIPLGERTTFDDKHVDAVTGYYFAERNEILYFYMGYPASPQPNRMSPYGSAQAAAIQRVGEGTATKLGVVLPPHETPGHWAAGWVGGLQLLPGKQHRWIALLNASPTAPDPADRSISREEPPPSLGGFAVCDEEWPVRGWRWCPQPIEWIQDIPRAPVKYSYAACASAGARAMM